MSVLEPTLGRPPLEDGKLDHMIAVPVTKEHRDLLAQEAHAAGYRSLAAYVRDCRLEPKT